MPRCTRCGTTRPQEGPLCRATEEYYSKTGAECGLRLCGGRLEPTHRKKQLESLREVLTRQVAAGNVMTLCPTEVLVDLLACADRERPGSR